MKRRDPIHSLRRFGRNYCMKRGDFLVLLVEFASSAHLCYVQIYRMLVDGFDSGKVEKLVTSLARYLSMPLIRFFVHGHYEKSPKGGH